MAANVMEIYGSKVFNEHVMKERLPSATYKSLKNTLVQGVLQALVGSAGQALLHNVLIKDLAAVDLHNICCHKSYSLLDLTFFFRLGSAPPGFVHAKVFVSDDRKAVVGTINLDYRSLYLHFEDAVYLYDCPCIKDIVADYDATRAQSQVVTHGDLARIPLHTRIAAALLKLVAPLM